MTTRISYITKEITDKITAACNVKEIILFGSYAYGEPHQYSDLDLLIVLNDRGIAASYWERVARRTAIFKVLGKIREEMPMDIFVYTIDEWEKILQTGFSFYQEINNRGVRIYDERENKSMA